MLYVNAQPSSAHLTLEAAQERAREFVASRRALKILGYFHVAPSKSWTYDYEIDACGEIASQVGTRLAYVLRQIADVLVNAELERASRRA